MRTNHWIYALATGLLLSFAGCDDGTKDTPAAEEDRGNVGKADLVGSCEGACGDISDGTCWCDDLCADFGDCCEDKAAVCDGDEGAGTGGVVECGDNPAQACITQDSCIPSACQCDEVTGQWLCTPDCGGGVECGPDDDDDGGVGTGDAAECTGDNPSEACIEEDSCIPSACECDEVTGSWLCTPDCSGGVECGPDGDTGGSAQCSGENPSEACIEPDSCIPSACACDAVTGSWLCTSDCSGGVVC